MVRCELLELLDLGVLFENSSNGSMKLFLVCSVKVRVVYARTIFVVVNVRSILEEVLQKAEQLTQHYLVGLHLQRVDGYTDL